MYCFAHPNSIAKNSPSYKTVDRSLSKSLEALKQTNVDLANETIYTENKIDVAIKAKELLKYKVISERYDKLVNLV